MRSLVFRRSNFLPLHRGIRTHEPIAAVLACIQKDAALLHGASDLQLLLGHQRIPEHAPQGRPCGTTDDNYPQSSATQRAKDLRHGAHASSGTFDSSLFQSGSPRFPRWAPALASPQNLSRMSRIPGREGGGARWLTSAAAQALPPSLAQELGDLLGDRFTHSAAVCEAHGRDESYHDCIPPNAVAFPQSTEEVAEVSHVTAPRDDP